MKNVCLFLCLLALNVYGQSAHIKEIKDKPSDRFYHTGDSTIVYPLIVTKNPAADKLMNAVIRAEVLVGVDPDDDPADQKLPLRKVLRNWEGLTFISYGISFNRNGILSMDVYVEEGGNNIIRHQHYFNFDVRTGTSLVVENLLDSARLDNFTRKVLVDKRKVLERYKMKTLKTALAKREIDKNGYNEAVQAVDECMKAVSMGDFSLSAKGLDIFDLCAVGGGMRMDDPEEKLSYPYGLRLKQ
jgi:hypothetical protein